ncbi:MAG: ABC transporter permease [Anaerolineaceae bacterium]|nr:ABC transporter permease [Anaerolineaceae bacterium]
MIRTQKRPVVGWFLQLAARRLAAQWRSGLTLIAGVWLAAVVGSSVPLYTAGITQIGLTQRLEQQSPDAVHIHTRTNLNASAEGGFAAAWTTLDSAAQDTIRDTFSDEVGWVRDIVTWGESAPLLLVRDGADVPDVRLRAAYYAGLDAETTLIAGAWPDDAPGDDYDLAVTIPESLSAALNLAVGDNVILDQRGWESSIPIRAHISGIWRENDPQAAYWMSPAPARLDGGSQIDANVFTTQAGLARITSDFLPQTSTQIGWRVLFDPAALPAAAINGVITRLESLKAGLQTTLSTAIDKDMTLVYATQLPEILRQYADEVTLLSVPFGLLLLQLAALVLFFLVVIGALVRRTDRREIAMLQSRGAPDSQILVFRGLEALLICLLAVLVAPVIAQQFLALLIPVFTGVTQVPLVLDPAAYLYAGVAALAAWVVLVVSLIPILRQPLVLAGGGDTRNGKQAWWQRLNLDLLFLVVGAGAVLRLVATNSALAETQTGSTQADPLLLLGPALLFFALGSVTLRLFPALMETVARLLSGGRGLTGALASWQISREPLHYGRITLLLALAVSLGLFAITFQTTLTTSQRDQADYAAGTDVRLGYGTGRGTLPIPSLEALQTLPGVQAISLAARLTGNEVSTSGGRLSNGTLLAVDHVFPQTVYWRDDLGTLAVPRPEEPLPIPGRPIPAGAQRIGVWILYEGYSETVFFRNADEPPRPPEFQPLPDRLLEQMALSLRVRDESGQAALLPLLPDTDRFSQETPDGELAFVPPQDGWLYFTSDLSSAGLIGEVRFEALAINERQASFRNPFESPSLFTLRDFEVEVNDETLPLADWIETGQWDFVNTAGTIPITLGTGEVSTAPADTPLVQVSWRWQGSNGEWGLVLDYPERTTTRFATGYNVELPGAEIQPIPALVSTRFARQQHIETGQTFLLYLDQSALYFRAAGIIRYFPTLYDDEGPFVVVDRDSLQYAVQRRPRSVFQDNEVWLRLDGTASTPDFLAAYAEQFPDLPPAQGVSRVGVQDSLQTDLLSLGVIGLLYFAFLVGMILSMVSLLTYAGITTQTRQSEFVVLRALGFSTRHVITGVMVEQVLVVALAVILGSAIGLLLSVVVLPALSTSAGGRSLTPPYQVTLDPLTAAAFFAVLGAILALQLVFSAWIVARLSRSQAVYATREV